MLNLRTCQTGSKVETILDFWESWFTLLCSHQQDRCTPEALLPCQHLILLRFFFFFKPFFSFFWSHHREYGILVPQPGTDSMLPVVEAGSLNLWNQESPCKIILADVLQYSTVACICMSLLANEAEHFSRGLQTIIYLFFFFAALGLPCFLCRLSLVAASEGHSSSWCTGFSLQRLLLLRSRASVVAALQLSSYGVWVLGHSGFNSCGVHAEKLWLVGPRARRLHQLRNQG